MTFWDTADIYAERVLGSRRQDIFLATKFGGNDPDTPMRGLTSVSTPSYIKRALARSLAHLDTSYIGLYYQHRVDPSVPVKVVLEALHGPLEDGAIPWLGLSACSAAVLRRAGAVPGIGRRVVACQMEFSPFELGHEKSGLVKAAGEDGVVVVAYSPLGRGMISGQYRSPADFDEGDLWLILPRFSEANFARNLELVDKFKIVTDKYSALPSQIALVEAVDVRGERLPKEYMHTNDCLPLEEWKGE